MLFRSELLLVDAVGTRPHDDARHLRMRQRFGIERPQPFERRIGVGKRLEINQVARHTAITPPMEFDTLLDLPADAFRGDAG